MGEIDEPQGSRPLSTRRLEVRRFRGGELGAVDDPDLVATEEPFEIRLGYSRRDGSRAEEPVSVTMRTPGHDEDLAVGFLFTEGIIHARSDVQSVVARGQRAADGLINVVRVELTPGVPVDFKRLERNFYMTSSCGVCGKASIEAVAVQGQYDVGAVDFRIDRRGARSVARRAEDPTGGVRADGRLARVGLFDATGTIVALREDVGRHNALDKLIGQALLRGELPLSRNGVIVSGRASFELMQKAKMAGCPLVVAVGAPSSLAVELAREFGITLVGFLKSDRFNVYSRPDRIL